MNHLVIVAHPRANSLTMCLAHAYIDELALQGHQHTLHDLYRLEFDPVLTCEEIARAGSGSPPPEVLQTQQDIKAADVLTGSHPKLRRGATMASLM